MDAGGAQSLCVPEVSDCVSCENPAAQQLLLSAKIDPQDPRNHDASGKVIRAKHFLEATCYGTGRCFGYVFYGAAVRADRM